MEKSESAMKGREQEDEYVQKIFFAAGSTLAIACFKYVLVMFLVEQWRLRVFLLLNLVLLAIFFTSVHSSSSHENEASNNIDVKTNKKKKKKKKRADEQSVGGKECDAHHEKIAGASGKECLTEKSDDAQEQLGEQVNDGSSSCEAPSKLSKEELNERVEAFITMFRQHLASDARKGRNHQFLSRPKQLKSKFTLPNQRVSALC